MAPKKRTTLRWTTCRTLVLKNDPDFPFCSERCRTIDLGKWASGAYKISSPALDPELLEEEAAARPKKDEDGGRHH